MRLHDSLPPLLRALGTTVILVAALVTALLTYADREAQRARPQASVQERTSANAAKADQNSAELNALTREVAGLRSSLQDDESLVEKVLTNPWFDLFGVLGTALIVSSFYVEFLIRLRRPR